MGVLPVSGDGDLTARIAYTILLFGAVVLGLRVAGWYFDWP